MVTEIAATIGGGIRFRHSDISLPTTIIFNPFTFVPLVEALTAHGFPSAAMLADVATLRGR